MDGNVANSDEAAPDRPTASAAIVSAEEVVIDAGPSSAPAPADSANDTEEYEVDANGMSKRRSLDASTLEWVHYRKSEAAEAERQRNDELTSSLTPEELVRVVSNQCGLRGVLLIRLCEFGRVRRNVLVTPRQKRSDKHANASY